MGETAISSTSILRKNNKNRILKFLSNRTTGVTKQTLANELNMSLPTITQNILELENEGVISFAEKMESSGGRKPKTIALNTGAKFAVGISLSYTTAHFVLLNLGGEEVAYQSKPLSLEKEPDVGLMVSYLLDKFLESSAVPLDKILGITLTLPGTINEDTGVVTFSPALQSNQEKLAKFIVDFNKFTKKYINQDKDSDNKFTLKIQNNATAGAYGEWWSKKEYSNVAYLSIDQGIGGGLVIGGQTYNGENFASCEFGHISIDPKGKKCQCGQVGCLETFCSTNRISKDINLTLSEFFSKLEQKEPTILALFMDYLINLSRGITTIHTLLNCNVIIGGELAQYITSSHMKQLRINLQMLSPFGDDGSYLQVATHQSKSACIGGALSLITSFISEY